MPQQPILVDARIVEALTAELVAIPSFEEEAAVQVRLAALLGEVGFDCSLQEVEPGRPNLLAVRGTGGPFLCSHADTQLPFAHDRPFTLRRERDMLVGRGALDAKGQIAALVAAVSAVPDAPATVLVTCDEEFGGLGSETVRLPEGLDGGAGGIVLEPTSFRICVAQAGNVEVELAASGRAVHMAEPEEGVSALEVVGDALEALRACPFLRAGHPLLPPAWRHVGRLAGGEHLWRVPGTATALASLAVLPGVDAHAAAGEVEAVLRRVSVLAAALGASLRWSIRDVNEPIEVPSGLPVVTRLRDAADAPLPLGGMRSWTDAANLLRLHGLPCVVFGAGSLAPAHSDREWVPLADLTRLAGTLARLLADWPGAATAT